MSSLFLLTVFVIITYITLYAVHILQKLDGSDAERSFPTAVVFDINQIGVIPDAFFEVVDNYPEPLLVIREFRTDGFLAWYANRDLSYWFDIEPIQQGTADSSGPGFFYGAGRPVIRALGEDREPMFFHHLEFEPSGYIGRSRYAVFSYSDRLVPLHELSEAGQGVFMSGRYNFILDKYCETSEAGSQLKDLFVTRAQVLLDPPAAASGASIETFWFGFGGIFVLLAGILSLNIAGISRLWVAGLERQLGVHILCGAGIRQLYRIIFRRYFLLLISGSSMAIALYSLQFWPMLLHNPRPFVLVYGLAIAAVMIIGLVFLQLPLEHIKRSSTMNMLRHI